MINLGLFLSRSLQASQYAFTVFLSCAVALLAGCSDGDQETSRLRGSLPSTTPARSITDHPTAVPHHAYVNSVQDHGLAGYEFERNAGDRVQAHNLSQRLYLFVRDNDVVIEPIGGSEWHTALHLQYVGRGARDLPVGVVTRVSFDDTRVTLERENAGGVQEWYLNSPLGIEQGFNLPQQPAGSMAEPVTIAVGISGDLMAELAPDGRSVAFQDLQGGTVLRYSNLYVNDAAGTSLPAWMSVGNESIYLHFDDRHAVYPVVVDPLITTEQAKFLPTSTHLTWAFYGYSVSMDGDTAIVGAHGEKADYIGAGAAYVYVRSGSTWVEQQRLTATNQGQYYRFGYSVGIKGDTAFIGGGPNAKAYVFERSGTTWTETQELLASDHDASSYFGNSVSVDTNSAIIGAPNDDEKAPQAGAAYVFVRSGTVWAEQQKLTGFDTTANAYFGASVSVDADTAIVGATNTIDEGTEFQQGSAYAFVRTGTTWALEQKIPGTGFEDNFGNSVSLEGDLTLIGAPNDDTVNTNAGAVFAFLRTGTTWNQEQKITSTNSQSSDRFGVSVSLSGDTAFIGANLANPPGGTDGGKAYAFVRTGTTWSEQQEIYASDSQFDGHFGGAVAIDGDNVIVGAHRDDDLGERSGAAYFYARTGTTWADEQKVHPNPPASSWISAGDYFGYITAVDGDTAMVGSRGDSEVLAYAGAVYVYGRTGTNWTELQKFYASDASNGATFGTALALEGDTAVIGAIHGNSAYVFTRTGTTWNELQKLVSGDITGSQYYGCSAAIDGDTVIIGSTLDTENGVTRSGSATVFVRTGTTWSEQAELTASDPETYAYFGNQVDVSGDIAVVAAYNKDEGTTEKIGAAYVFVRTGTVWNEQVKLTATNADQDDRFGTSVAIAGDTLIVGTPNDDDIPTDSGAAYVYVTDGTSWTEQAKITATDTASGDRFGTYVVLEGETALIGSPRHNTGTGNGDEGAAYVFARSGTNWVELGKITAAGGITSDYLGSAIAFDTDTAIIGAYGRDERGQYSGAAYAFLYKRDLGDPCEVGEHCDSTYCVDGVCCNAACGGGATDDCQACSTAAGAAANGTCGPMVCTDDTVFCNGVEECQLGVCVSPGNNCTGPDGDSDCQESCSEQNKNCLGNDTDGSPCPGGTCQTGVCTSAGGGGQGGVGGFGGSPATGGTGGVGGPPATGGTGGVGGPPATGGTGGVGGPPATGGTGGVGGAPAAGGTGGVGGAPAAGGAAGQGGSVATGGAAGQGGSVASGGAAGQGGSVATGGSGIAGAAGATPSAGGGATQQVPPEDEDDGCGCRLPGKRSSNQKNIGWLLALAIAGSSWRRRSRRRRQGVIRPN